MNLSQKKIEIIEKLRTQKNRKINSFFSAIKNEGKHNDGKSLEKDF